MVDCFRKYLCLSQGQWAGKPFELDDIQREQIIYPLFGWVDENGLRRFRRSYIEMPKKNGKSTLAAGIGLYMEVFDGEPASEVYSLGADKDQARIVHNEAIRMVEASEELRKALKVNRTTGQIGFQTSIYKALSSGGRGKAGINIHCAIVDELHEWTNDDVWNAIRYGFRARQQPLQFVITNAGDDPNSICKRQHDYARALLDGREENHTFLPLILCAPRDDAEAEIEAVRGGATKLPVARKCNPGLGTIISERDLATEIREAIATPSELPNLLRLTYSVWSGGGQSWLPGPKWDACRGDFGELLVKDDKWVYTGDTLTGLDCWAGLDLSKNRDLTAFVMVFRDGDTFYQLPMFWMPEEPARAGTHLAPYMDWARDGFIRVCEGEVINYAEVVGDIIAAAEMFEINEIMYDPWQGEPIRQEIESESYLECVKFEQTARNFASPTEDYERLINSGHLLHSGNAVLSWQSSHVEVKSDQNKNKRPVKRKSGDFRTIDGIVAGVMGLFGALDCEPFGSYYDSNELEMI